MIIDVSPPGSSPTSLTSDKAHVGNHDEPSVLQLQVKPKATGASGASSVRKAAREICIGSLRSSTRKVVTTVTSPAKADCAGGAFAVASKTGSTPGAEAISETAESAAKVAAETACIEDAAGRGDAADVGRTAGIDDPTAPPSNDGCEIGRASCRERVESAWG